MGKDGAGHDRVLDGGENAQAAATAGASENIESEQFPRHRGTDSGAAAPRNPGKARLKSPCASAASRCIHGLSPTVADVVDSRPFIPSAHRWPHS